MVPKRVDDEKGAHQAGSPSARRPAMLAAMAQQILSPLNAVVGFASILAEHGEELDVDARRRYAAHVQASGDALRTFVERLFEILGHDGDVAMAWSSSDMALVAERQSGSMPVARRPSSTPPIAGSAVRPVILVVDSDRWSRELMCANLAGRGYELVPVDSGEAAILAANSKRPDLALIDTQAGTTDGFETARRLKELAGGQYLPIVFVTTLGDDDSRLRALEVGAEQYLPKPVNRYELRTRVRNLLNIRSQQKALAAQNAELRSLQRFKDETTAMLVHDLKGPLSAMAMNLDFALEDLPRGLAFEPVRNALEDCSSAGERLFRMIANLLDVAKGEEGRLVPKREVTPLREHVSRAVLAHRVEAATRRVDVECRVDSSITVHVDPDLFGRVLANLLENALRHTRAGGHIVVDARSTPAAVAVDVANDGPAVVPELRPILFEKYAQGSGLAGSRSLNRGLGLYFCRVAVEAHGGRIALVDGPPGLPTCFRIELPVS